jgi:4-oxalocrotonate tautomerase
MPSITVEGPVIKDIEVKRTLIKELTEAALKAYKLPPQAIVAVIKENLPENVGVGGQLICDRK